MLALASLTIVVPTASCAVVFEFERPAMMISNHQEPEDRRLRIR